MRAAGVLFILILVAASACRPVQQHHIAPAFYYWKTGYPPGAYELARLQAAASRCLYIRCFDVAIDAGSGQPAPVGVIRGLRAAPAGMAQVPVVFIAQPALTGLTPVTVQALSRHIDHLLAQLFEGLSQPAEIQIDCDWTAGTKDAYFSLLKALRSEAFFKKKILSCTIRLHQVRYYARSGIPPVDRGLLMCYNMGNLKQPGSHNSILDVPLAKQYLGGLHAYPLALDVALPLFSWCLQFRGGKFAGILRGVSPESVGQAGIFQEESEHLFSCIADTVWMEYRFRRGDLIRTESPGISDILQLAQYTAARVRTDSLRVALFHADSLTLSKYSDDDIQAIYGAYR